MKNILMYCKECHKDSGPISALINHEWERCPEEDGPGENDIEMTAFRCPKTGCIYRTPSYTLSNT